MEKKGCAKGKGVGIYEFDAIQFTGLHNMENVYTSLETSTRILMQILLFSVYIR